MRINYEPSSEPLHISAKQSFLNPSFPRLQVVEGSKTFQEPAPTEDQYQETRTTVVKKDPVVVAA